MRKIILLLMAVFFMTAVSAWNSTQFNNTLANETLTLNAGTAVIRYLAVPVPNVSVVTNGTMNLSGMRAGVGRYENDSIEENPATALVAEVGGVNWKSQTFTIGTTGANINYTIANVSMFLGNKLGTPGTCVLGIRAVDGANKPTGNDLTNGTFNCNNVQAGASTRDWINFTMGTAFTVTTGTKYAIVLRAVAGTPSVNSVSAFGTSSSTYTGGTRVSSTDSGSTWTVNAGDDINFIIFGTTGTAINFTVGVGEVTTLISANGTVPYSEIITGLQSSVNNYLSGCTLVNGFCNVPFMFNSSVAGTITYSDLWFDSPELIETGQRYSNTTVGGSVELFQINVTIDGAKQISSAYINYNGTQYAGSVSSLGGGNYTVSRNVNVPYYSTVQNQSWFWNITLNDNYNYLSTLRNQTVSTITLDACGTNTVMIYNFTLRDEDLQTLLTPAANYNTSIEVELELYPVGSSASALTFSQNYTKINPARVCITSEVLNTTSYEVYGVVKYSSQDRVIEYYNIQNFTLNNNTISQNIILFDLLTTSSQEFLITWKDENFIPRGDVVLEIQRKYVSEGTFKTVEVPLTDSDGKAVGHFVLSDEIYTIYVKQYGEILAVFENLQAFCSNIATGDCTIELNALAGTTAPDNFLNYLGLAYVPYYNQTSRTMSIYYDSIDNSVKTVQLNVTLYDNYLNQSVCSNSLIASSGTVSCVIPASYYNKTVLVQGYVDGELLFTSVFDVELNKSGSANPLRYILAIALILILVGMAVGSGSPEIVLTAYVAGILASITVYLLDDGGLFGAFSAFSWLIVGTIILIVGIVRWRGEH